MCEVFEMGEDAGKGYSPEEQPTEVMPVAEEPPPAAPALAAGAPAAEPGPVAHAGNSWLPWVTIMAPLGCSWSFKLQQYR
jgi:hypothetical protein